MLKPIALALAASATALTALPAEADARHRNQRSRVVVHIGYAPSYYGGGYYDPIYDPIIPGPYGAAAIRRGYTTVLRRPHTAAATIARRGNGTAGAMRRSGGRLLGRGIGRGDRALVPLAGGGAENRSDSRRRAGALVGRGSPQL